MKILPGTRLKPRARPRPNREGEGKDMIISATMPGEQRFQTDVVNKDWKLRHAGARENHDW